MIQQLRGVTIDKEAVFGCEKMDCIAIDDCDRERADRLKITEKNLEISYDRC